jgi:hypothetical protein
MEILVYQSFITIGHERKLNPNELYLYVQLRRRMSIDYKVETTVDLLSKRVTFLKTPKRNRLVIRKLLDSLQQKGAITFNEEDGVVDVEVVYFEENFDMVPLKVLEISSPEEFMLLVWVFRHQKYKGLTKMSFEYASRLLESSEKTAFKVIDELVNVGKLHKISGPRKEDSQQQEPNQYYIPSLVDKEKSPKVESKPKEQQKTIENDIQLEALGRIGNTISKTEVEPGSSLYTSDGQPKVF